MADRAHLVDAHPLRVVRQDDGHEVHGRRRAVLGQPGEGGVEGRVGDVIIAGALVFYGSQLRQRFPGNVFHKEKKLFERRLYGYVSGHGVGGKCAIPAPKTRHIHVCLHQISSAL